MPAIQPALRRFSYKQVQLGDSRLLEQLLHNRSLFMSISDDKLLKPFRVRARQSAPGEDMGGWYDASDDFHIDPNDYGNANWHGYIPGHSFGQYLSGLSRCYAASGDAAIQRKIRDLVQKYAATIHPLFFAGYPLPAYTYDKLVIGLVDAYQYAGVTLAKPTLDHLTDIVIPFLPEKALTREERRARPYTQEAEIWDEPYTLPEHLFLAWQAGMGERYKHLAARYLQDEALFDPLARGQSPLKGKHAYSHVNALNSAVQAYLVQGDRKYLDAARNGFAFVQAQSYATGGWGPNEELLAADDTETLLASLSETHRSFETPCGAYGHFKIARSLLQITKSSHYGDSMERVLYNTVLGARPTLADGSTFYYADYADSARKVFRGEAWPCCSGTFIQLAADYGISAYLQADQALYVNLYVPSSVQMAVAGQTVTIEQKTSYPLTNTSTLTVRAAKASEFTVQLRIPAWAGPDTRILVNDVQVALTIAPGAFLPLSRVWQPGDRLRIDFDMRTRLEPIHPAHPDVVSLLVGPLVLFPLLPAPAVLHRDQLLQAKRVAPALWKIDAEGVVITLKPFMEIGDEAYRLYMRVRALTV
ncbi:beta-L-arabinofuranosidase domain-containing protein [Duganella sp. PWIR1]